MLDVLSRVKNVDDTTADVKFGAIASWQAHLHANCSPLTHQQVYWEQATGIVFAQCIHSSCHKHATVGAHVYVEARGDAIWIVPLCSECNYTKNTAWMSVDTGTCAVLRAEP